MTGVRRPALILASVAFAVLSYRAPAESTAERFDPGQIATGELDTALAEQGWRLLTKRNVAPTVFTADGLDTIRIAANNSNALIYRELPEAGYGDDPVLTWEWRVDAVSRGDGTGADSDWPVVVYAAFDVDKQYVGWWRRLMNRLTFSFAGLPATGKILTYVWGLDEPAGAEYPNPYIPRVAYLQVLRSAQSVESGWLGERRDMIADFEAAFGHPAKGISFIAISADSEDTGSVTRAAIRSLSIE